jgi:5-methylcytosine-specific restriction protein B
MRIDSSGAVVVKPGVFLEWNEQALEDQDNTYVLLVEELTRANLSAVLGELLTYLEYRDRTFYTVYSRRPVQIAQNLVLIATYNPTDQSAIEIDAALLRRLRILRFPPSTSQLREMLDGVVPPAVIAKLALVFDAAAKAAGGGYEDVMPFGHGVFAEIKAESPDLFLLWRERIEHILRQPLKAPHQLTSIIENTYPWRNPHYLVGAQSGAAATPAVDAVQEEVVEEQNALELTDGSEAGGTESENASAVEEEPQVEGTPAGG